MKVFKKFENKNNFKKKEIIMNRIKLIFILSVLFFIVFSNYSQTKKAPKIYCEGASYNFGTIPNTKIIKHTFIIKNIGDDVLKISTIRVSCGCTIAKIKDKVILPGKKTELKVELDLSGTIGEQFKDIIIESNDQSKRFYRLYLKGITESK